MILKGDNNIQELDVELSEEVAEGVYSNMVIISQSSSEFVFDFVRLMPGTSKAHVKSRVILSPEHAKRLLISLQDNLTRYEAIMGRINLTAAPSDDTQIAMSFSSGEA